MGHEDVQVLDGGLKKWKAEGRRAGGRRPAQAHRAPLHAADERSLLRNMDDVKKVIQKRSAQLVIHAPATTRARRPSRVPACRRGHLPGARNVPVAGVTINADGTLKSTPELAKIFANAGIDPERPVVTSCGLGMTASILSLALAVLGQTNC